MDKQTDAADQTESNEGMTILEIAQECVNPRFEGWEFMTKTDSGNAQLFRRLHDNKSGLYEWATLHVLDNVNVDKFFAVNDDLDYVKHWNKNVKSIRQIEVNGKNLIHWETNSPGPLSNRDSVFSREIGKLIMDGHVMHTRHMSTVIGIMPEREGVVRVEDLNQIICGMTDPENPSATRISMYMYNNPGGILPSWFINLIVKVHFSKQTQRIVDAYYKYDNWKREQKAKSTD